MMNDFIDALKTRINSPVLGYFGFAVLAFNWQAFFFLFVQDNDVPQRIQFFEQNTTASSLIGWPLTFSLSFSVLYPWITLFVTWLSAKPMELKEVIQANSEHKILVRRKQLEEARSKLLANAEVELIERAKRDQELDMVQNEELRQKLRAELDQLRAERDSSKEATKSPNLSPQARHKELMDIADTYRQRSESPKVSVDDRERFRRRARDLEEQAYKSLFQSDFIEQGVD